MISKQTPGKWVIHTITDEYSIQVEARYDNQLMLMKQEMPDVIDDLWISRFVEDAVIAQQKATPTVARLLKAAFEEAGKQVEIGE